MIYFFPFLAILSFHGFQCIFIYIFYNFHCSCERIAAISINAVRFFFEGLRGRFKIILSDILNLFEHFFDPQQNVNVFDVRICIEAVVQY